MTDYQTIQRYTRPPYFADCADFDRREYYVIESQTRDSDTLSRSNFRSVLRALGGESDTVRIVHDRHFLCGWVESIYVHESDTHALDTADQLMTKAQDYPVIDEDDWSTLEYETAAESWHQMSLANRVHACQRYRVSVFAARHDDVPDSPTGELIPYLADGH